MKRSTRLVVAASCLIALTGAGIAPALADNGNGWAKSTGKFKGVTVTDYTNGNAKVRTYGGAKLLDYVADANSAEVHIELPAPIEATARRSIPPTVYEYSLAAGMSAEDACAFAQDMDPYGCLTSRQVARGMRSDLGRRSTSSSDFIDSPCFDHVTYAGDGSKHAHACISRYHDAWTTNYRWIANKMKSTAWTVDPGWVHDRINGVGVQAQYAASDSAATDWDPYTTETISSSCHTVTESASGKNGFSYSTSETVCPDKLNPWHSPAFQYTGAKWTGDAAPADENRGVVATSVQKIPRSQGYAMDIGSWISWN
jgi:hypothetical protein